MTQMLTLTKLRQMLLWMLHSQLNTLVCSARKTLTEYES